MRDDPDVRRRSSEESNKNLYSATTTGWRRQAQRERERTNEQTNKRTNSAVHHTRRRQRRRRRKLKTKRRQWRAGFYLWRHQLSRHHREEEERTQQEDIAAHLCSAQCSALCTIILFRHFFPSFLPLFVSSSLSRLWIHCETAMSKSAHCTGGSANAAHRRQFKENCNLWKWIGLTVGRA